MGTGAKVLVDLLELAGVRRVYGVPGEHCLELVDEIGRSAGIDFVAARHESGAAYMAEAEAKLTGVPGVCIGTAGVGAANLSIGIHTARQDSTPMLVLLGQISTKLRHREAWQEVDLAAAFMPQAKWAVEISRADRVAELTARAIRTATSDRPGPVVLSLPEDVQAATAPEAPAILAAAPTGALSPADADKVVEAMRAATAPLLLLGGGLKGYGGAAALSRLAARTGADVVVGFRRHDSYPNDDPAYIGAISLNTPPAVTEALERADLVVALGTRLSELTTLRYRFPAAEQRLIHIDPSSAVLASSHVQAEAAYVSDSVAAAQALAAAADAAGATSTIAMNTATTAGETTRTFAFQSHHHPVTADVLTRAAAAVEETLEDDAIVTSDAGDFYPPFADAIRYIGGRRYLGPTSGAMGYGLPAAIAAAAASPGRQVVALAGDGGFMMSIAELETASRLGLDLTVLVVNDAQYGSIGRHQRAHYDGRLVGVELSATSFAEVARSLGADGYLVAPEQLPAQLRHARERGGVTVLELRL